MTKPEERFGTNGPGRHTKGLVCVFEGPDDVGKTTIVAAVYDILKAEGHSVLALSFPGRTKGTLGAHIHELHHRPKTYGVLSMTPDALQVLHIAAHVDAIRTRIRPHVESGGIVLLDRYWWSTWVYGRLGGVTEAALELMIELERHYWQDIEPNALFLISRSEESVSQGRKSSFAREAEEYASLAARRRSDRTIVHLHNDGPVARAAQAALGVIKTLVSESSLPHTTTERATATITPADDWQLPFNTGQDAPLEVCKAGSLLWSRPAPPQPTVVFDTYWRFAAERQAIFYRRLRGEPRPWTSDHILRRYKFTNVYRASDRVSQYLIRHVIYAGDQTPTELFFRVLLFKLFNRIETWSHLLADFGELRATTFDVGRYDRSLTRLLERHEPIYSGAYIMPTGGKQWHETRKHRMHLRLLEYMLSERVPERLQSTRSMKEAFELLRALPTLGNFLAYQYVIDLNYSTLTDFDEDAFVMAGPGAREGIRKCFSSLGGLSESDVIRLMCERQKEEFADRDLRFESLWGRRLYLTDCQNLFCEVDKYARVFHPEATGKSGRTRIKQQFRPALDDIEYWYPPKWKLNELVQAERDRTLSAAGS